MCYIARCVVSTEFSRPHKVLVMNIARHIQAFKSELRSRRISSLYGVREKLNLTQFLIQRVYKVFVTLFRYFESCVNYSKQMSQKVG